MALRRRRFRWLAFALVGATIGLLVAFFPREKRLLEHATKVAECAGWYEYFWLSSQELLIHHDPPEINGAGRYKVRLGRLRPDTRTETELTALNRLLNGSLVRHGYLQISPDGRRALWEDERRGICTARLDGSDYHKWPGWWMKDTPIWMGEGRQWVLFQDAYSDEKYRRLTVRSVAPPFESRTVAIPPTAAPTRSYHFETGRITAQGRVLVDETERDMASTQGFTRQSRPVIAEYRLLPEFAFVKRWPISLPPKTMVYESAFSPQGDRIAWVTKTDQTSAWLTWLHRFLPALNVKPRGTLSLWVSRLDSGASLEIGSVPATEEGTLPLELDNLHWLPDGRQLSFRYQGSLWTVPVE